MVRVVGVKGGWRGWYGETMVGGGVGIQSLGFGCWFWGVGVCYVSASALEHPKAPRGWPNSQCSPR